MSRGLSGVYIKKHLHDFHLADIERITVDGAIEHMKLGCEFKPGWKERVMAKVLEALPDMIGELLEAEESFCPPRRIGVKEAA